LFSLTIHIIVLFIVVKISVLVTIVETARQRHIHMPSSTVLELGSWVRIPLRDRCEFVSSFPDARCPTDRNPL